MSTQIVRRQPTAAEVRQQERETEIALELKDQTRRIVALIGDPSVNVGQLQASVMLAVAGNSYLHDCDRSSLVLSVLQAARFGVRSFSGPFAGAYLVPFGRQVTPIISYKYLIDVAIECGAARRIKGETVYDADDFDYLEGTDEYIRHKKALRGGNRDVEHFLCAYAVAILSSGIVQATMLPYEDVMGIRASALAKRDKPDAPWNAYFDRQAAKTAVRRLCNMIGLNPDRHARLTQLIEADDAAGQGRLIEPMEEVREKLEAQDRAAGPTGVFEQPTAQARAKERLAKQESTEQRREQAPPIEEAPPPEEEAPPPPEEEQGSQGKAETPTKGNMAKEDALAWLDEVGPGEEGKLKDRIRTINTYAALKGDADIKKAISSAWGRVRNGGGR